MNIKKKLFTFLFIANILVLLSNLPLIIRIYKTPSGFIFPLTHSDAYHDYALYLSAITQGKNGNLLFADPYTVENSSKSIFYIYYIAVGKVAAIFHLSSPIAYHLSRLIGIEIFIYLLYFLVNQILDNKKGFWALIIILFCTVSPPFLFKDQIIFPVQIPWWMGFDALERLNQIPHNIFGQNILLVSIICLVSFWRKKRVKFAVVSAIAVFIGGIVFPPILLIAPAILLTYILNIIIRTIKLKKINIDKYHLYGTALIIVSAFLSLSIIKWQETQGFPWNIWTSWNVSRWNMYEPNFNYSLYILFGILPILAIPAIISAFKKNHPEHILLTFWLLSPLILLPFANFLNLPKLRLVQALPFVPIGLLITLSIFEASAQTKRLVRRIFIILVFAFLEIPVTAWILSKRLNFVIHETSFPGFLSPDVYASLQYINSYIPKGSVILSYEYFGNLIPALSPVKSFVGHLALTKNFAIKKEAAVEFLKQNLSDDEAKNFVDNNRINYVYFGPDEKAFGLNKLTYSFLTPVSVNNQVTIYRIIK